MTDKLITADSKATVMRGARDSSVLLRELVHIGLVAGTGVFTVGVLYFLSTKFGLSLQSQLVAPLAIFTGIVLGLSPPTINISKAKGRLVIGYWSILLTTAVCLTLVAGSELWAGVAGATALVVAIAGWIYHKTSLATHSLLVPAWLAILGIYTISLVSFVDLVITAGSLTVVIFPLIATGVIAATHQAFIDERSEYFLHPT